MSLNDALLWHRHEHSSRRHALDRHTDKDTHYVWWHYVWWHTMCDDTLRRWHTVCDDTLCVMTHCVWWHTMRDEHTMCDDTLRRWHTVCWHTMCDEHRCDQESSRSPKSRGIYIKSRLEICGSICIRIRLHIVCVSRVVSHTLSSSTKSMSTTNSVSSHIVCVITHSVCHHT